MRIDSLDQLYDQYRRHLAVVEQLRDQVREDPALGKALLTAALQDINDGPDWRGVAKKLAEALHGLMEAADVKFGDLDAASVAAMDAANDALLAYGRAKRADQ